MFKQILIFNGERSELESNHATSTEPLDHVLEPISLDAQNHGQVTVGVERFDSLDLIPSN